MRYRFIMTAIAMASAALAGTPALATSFVKYGDRSAFDSAAGTTRTETFNQITSDVTIESGYKVGGFTLSNHRPYGPYGSSAIDAPPLLSSSGINGTSYLTSTVYNNGTLYQSSLIFDFDEAITAFGANFKSGGGGHIEMLIDGVLLQGGVDNLGDFFGFTSDTAFKRLELRARNGSGYTYNLDDVSYSSSSVTAAVPEPATWAMMLAGFGLIGGTMRAKSGKRRVRFA